jgi:Asp-tRNA(Asn)/Glu-tRNA(Gln) amidotransferase A subunit family amidase
MVPLTGNNNHNNHNHNIVLCTLYYSTLYSLLLYSILYHYYYYYYYSVRGIDHSVYAEHVQSMWSTCLYPYHISDYTDVIALTHEPVVVYTINYNAHYDTYLTENFTTHTIEIPLLPTTTTTTTAAAFREQQQQQQQRIDGVIFYVDYYLSPIVSIPATVPGTVGVGSTGATATTTTADIWSPYDNTTKLFAKEFKQSVKFFQYSRSLPISLTLTIQLEDSLESADFDMSFAFS